MIRPLFQIEPLLPLIEADKLILTPNNRLCNQIKLAYRAYLDSRVVVTPRIFSLREWQERQWQTLQNLGHPQTLRCLANGNQNDFLWQEVIAESGLNKSGAISVLERRALARQARDAYATMTAWQQNISGQHIDGEFLSWCRTFEQKLTQHKLITEEQAQVILRDAFSEGFLKPEPDIYLHSFIDTTPLAQSLLDHAGEKQINLSKNAIQPSLCVKTRAEDSKEEVFSAATWAWEILQKNPEATIAIISPQLSRDRNQIERQLVEIFESHSLDPASPHTAPPFNISAAQLLAQTPLIASTLQLLQLNLPDQPLHLLITILHSPYFGSRESEFGLRAYVIEALKKRGSFTGNVNDISHSSNRYCEQQANCEDQNALLAWRQLNESFQHFTNARRRGLKLATPSQWVEFFQQQLIHLGWPGQRRIDSVEFQQITHWYTLLESFAAMDNMVANLSLDGALSLLKDMAQTAPFQTETRDTPIHILGAFEAVGLHFSHCWVLGLNDKEWPTPLKPNPLLPKSLQSRLDMPRASLSREVDIARQLTQHFLQTADQLVVSFAHQISNSQVRESSLISALPGKDLIDLIAAKNPGLSALKNQLRQQQRFDWVDCTQGPPLNTSLETPARGGQNLFKLQAQCPFNGFAQLRLQAQNPDPPSLGLGPKEKGTVIHNALASIWDKIKTHSALNALSITTLDKLVTDAVGSCCASIGKKDVVALGDYYYQLEQQRLCNLILQWLHWEQQRPPFTVVATEQELKTEFQGIHLRMRIDRVDQLEDGAILLIDYKTSPQTVNTWMQERPSEPQLPLYCLCYPKQVHGITFANLSNEELGFRGLALPGDALGIEGIKTTKAVKVDSWNTLQAEFQQRLQQLAHEIVNGDCRIMFQSAYQPSRDPLAPLNRVFETDYINYRWRTALSGIKQP